MKKVFGSELSFVDREEAFLPAGAAPISFETKSSDVVLQPGFLAPSNNFVQANTFPISSFVRSGSAAFALVSPETIDFAPDNFNADTSISAGDAGISAASAPLVLISNAPLSNEDIASADRQIDSIVSVSSTTGFTINLKFDAAASAPGAAGFRAGIQQAASLLAAAITDKITVNLIIDYSGIGGGAGARPDNGFYVSYSTVRADLINNAMPGDHTFDALPGGSSIQGQSHVAVWNAQAKLAGFGLLAANDSTTDDGFATFATDIPANRLVGVALHELTHAMGRFPMGAGNPVFAVYPGETATPDIFNLFRFTSAGNRFFDGHFTTSTASYFSIDGGNFNSRLADYGQQSDASDFLNSGVQDTSLQGADDPFDEFYHSALQQLTAVDLKQLDALGFHLSSGAPSHIFATPTFQLAGFAPGAGGWISDDKYPRELADVNGDHMADIVGFGQAGVYVSLAAGGGNFGPGSFKLAAFAPGAGGWTSEDHYPRELADVNGDGMADIVGFGEAGVYVSLATGGGNFGPGSFKPIGFAAGAGGWISEDRYPRVLADVNGDHMADIVGFGEAGVYVALATGGGNFGTPSFKFAGFAPGAGGWVNDTLYHREVADVNGDGMADIVGFGQAGVYVALATGGGAFAAGVFDLQAFAPGAGGWNSDDTYPRHLADINQDGAADIVGFGQAGVYDALSNGFHLI
jgi:hypothetical protein